MVLPNMPDGLHKQQPFRLRGVLKLLVEHEADIHEATSRPGRLDKVSSEEFVFDLLVSARLGAQPIHLAAKEGHLETVEYLLELGAVHCLELLSCAEAIAGQWLAQARAVQHLHVQDINARDRNWKTPVSLACQKGHLEVYRCSTVMKLLCSS